MEVIRLEIPAQADYVSTLRLTTSSLAANAKADVEEIEDLKVCVSEIANVLIQLGQPIRVNYQLSPESIRIAFAINEQARKDSFFQEHSDLNRLIVTTLMDELEETDEELILVKKFRE